jgi:ATP-binding cassette subfamily C (CFTR/MRP) protein 1
VTALLLVGVQIALVVLWSSNRVTGATLPSAILSFLSALVILCLSNLEHTRTVRPSLLLNVYLLGSLVFDAVQVRTLYLRNDHPSILGLFTTNIVIKAALLLLEAKSKRTYLRPPYNAYSPEMTSGVFSHSFFWWIRPLLATGFRKMLTLDDLFQADEGLLSEPLLSQMQDSWAKCMFEAHE